MIDGPVVAFAGDIHGDEVFCKELLDDLEERNVQCLFLLGDLGGGDIVTRFRDYNVHTVIGNNDDPTDLATAMDVIDGTFHGEAATVGFGRKRFHVRHGVKPRELSYAMTIHVDYVVHGHYHVFENSETDYGHVLSPGDSGVLYYHIDADRFEQRPFEQESFEVA